MIGKYGGRQGVSIGEGCERVSFPFYLFPIDEIDCSWESSNTRSDMHLAFGTNKADPMRVITSKLKRISFCPHTPVIFK